MSLKIEFTAANDESTSLELFGGRVVSNIIRVEIVRAVAFTCQRSRHSRGLGSEIET